jgi:hypothetical protein
MTKASHIFIRTFPLTKFFRFCNLRRAGGDRFWAFTAPTLLAAAPASSRPGLMPPGHWTANK